MFPTPILAVDIRLIFWLIVIGFSFLSWLSKRIKEAQMNQQKKDDGPQRRRPQDQALQNEIEAFLSQVTGTAKPAGNSNQSSSSFERQLERREQQTQSRQQQQQSQKQRQKKQQRASTSNADQKREEPVSRRHLAKSKLSDVEERHVDSSVKNRHLDSSVASQHLQSTIETDPAGVGSNHMPLNAGGVARLMRQPGFVRNAIVLNEILSRPVSQRKK